MVKVIAHKPARPCVIVCVERQHQVMAVAVVVNTARTMGHAGAEPYLLLYSYTCRCEECSNELLELNKKNQQQYGFTSLTRKPLP